jgi:hypothetical protein
MTALRAALLIAKDQVDADSSTYSHPLARGELKALYAHICELYQVATNAKETATPA